MTSIVLAIVVVIALVTIGLPRARRIGHVDLLHPLLFPTIYVTIATMAPTIWIYTRGDLGIARESVLSRDTPGLTSLAVVGFAVGAALPFKRLDRPIIPFHAPSLILVGRLLMLVPLTLAAVDVVSNTVLTRGIAQDTRSIGDSVDATAFILASTCVLLIAAGQSRLSRPFSRLDLIMVTSLVVLLGLNGRRGASIAVILIVVAAYTRRLGRASTSRPVIVGALALLTFAYVVVTYRASALGERTQLGPVEVILRDLSSVPFTTGTTSRLVDISGPFYGTTISAGVYRQLPGPISNYLFGQPDDTGAFAFRTLYNAPDSQGYGYSIAAEGVLNFGAVGAFTLPFVMGASLAWLYARANLRGHGALELGYFIAMATLPFAWRSDVLGALKGVTYPMLAIWIVFVYARTMHEFAGRRLAPHSALSKPLRG